jgi:flagellar biogenesis protein FliO
MQSFSLLAQLIASLGGVLGLIWLLARTAQKRGWMSGGTSASKPIRIVARHGLTKHTSLAVVRVGDRELLLGVGNGSVNILLDEEAGQLLTVNATVAPALPARQKHRALAGSAARPVMATEGTVTTSGFSPSSARKPMLDRLRARTVRH